jgi:protein-L-isoaspartate(D-aspartate) O-methyltransferase
MNLQRTGFRAEIEAAALRLLTSLRGVAERLGFGAATFTFGLAALAFPEGCAFRGCDSGEAPPGACVRGPDSDRTRNERRAMVENQIAARGIRDARVLEALADEPRHAYVPEEVRGRAYADHPLPIGFGQTISQPYIVARMTEALNLSPGDRVLEIGTGSGYQAAILDRLAASVYTIEIVEPLCERARRDLAANGHGRVQVRCGDGWKGWPEAAPFDRIIVTAAPDRVPPALVEQLRVGGLLVLPLGEQEQWLLRLTKQPDGFLSRELLEAVRFVPMTGGP